MKALKRILKILAVIFFAAIVLDAATLAFFSLYQPPLKKADAIVVLGAAINSPVLYRRALEGLKLYQEGLAPVLVLSGGRISRADISEAGYMEKVIDHNAQKPLNLILEENSHSTFENLKNSKTLLPPGSRVILVTDNYHLARSVLTAERIGYGNVQWHSPGFGDYSFRNLAYYYAREVLAMLDYLPKFALGR